MKLLHTMISESVESIAETQGKKILQAFDRDTGTTPAGVKNEPESIVSYIASYVPRKALQWVVNQYKRNEVKLEDMSQLGEDLKLFTKVRPRLAKKDLNQYKSLDELYDAIEEFKEEGAAASHKELKRKEKLEGAEKIVEKPGFYAIQLKTANAACDYVKGTKWCTSNKEQFDHYNKDGPLFVVIAKDDKGKDKKFQIHYESGSLMNDRDRPLSKQEIEFLSKHDGWTEFLNHLIKKHYGHHIEDQQNENVMYSFKSFLINEYV